jgi:hypothetical protein
LRLILRGNFEEKEGLRHAEIVLQNSEVISVGSMAKKRAQKGLS